VVYTIKCKTNLLKSLMNLVFHPNGCSLNKKVNASMFCHWGFAVFSCR